MSNYMIHTLIVLKNNIVIQQDTSYNVEELKNGIAKKLQPYFNDAKYYGKEEFYLDGEKFTLLYQYWWMDTTR